MISKMKTLLFAFFVAFLFSFTAQAQDSGTWMLDKDHTSVNFSINHFFSEVKGNFTDFDGSFQLDPQNPASGKISFTVKVKSINTENAKRDSHLQSPDFFDAKTYPEITFVSTKLEPTSKNEFLAHGNLTMRGVTKKVSLPFKITGEMEHPMMKDTMILGLLLNTSLNRTHYNVGTGSWSTTMVVGDEVQINIPMELNQKK
ncbi:YceI family protein [Aequorivita antarctica]|uniref:YceI family protein n=1 Tax=Aequorivita antarctica TaxID=153266 RepID=A0A5C6YZF7_9FLAO|nr:YceI family protein [Aequorivita antarctica]TXD73054.1 YceI family protein [Aequorivita antarctica]SRX76177.1 Protein YceI [Aequorivita antarctica]